MNNINFIKRIERVLQERLPVKLGVNKLNELVRLIYELSMADNIPVEKILSDAGLDAPTEEDKGGLFHRAKDSLLHMRYPSIGEGDDPHIMPLKQDKGRRECPVWDFKLSPSRIYVEEQAQKDAWTAGFLEKFPEAEVVKMKDIRDGLKTFSARDPVEVYNSRRENIFVVRNKTAFTKKCPCTAKAQRCGYLILNLGFGCPMDCSYCYLETYSNAPGLLLASNIEEYYPYIKDLDRKTGRRRRIGTGEFTDSLAMDRYTEYSSYLIPLFAGMKNLVLELKTKTADIDAVLAQEPNDNVVISWSVNTEDMARRYEKGGAAMGDRIKAAERAAERGYKIGFHFDPIVYYPGWEEEYGRTVEDIFSRPLLTRNTVWISLGTLRYTPGLKQAAERRFGDNRLFYTGEFFADMDGKLRYPRDLRIDMYDKMADRIRSSGVGAWVYLCMEPEEIWERTSLKDNSRTFGRSKISEGGKICACGK